MKIWCRLRWDISFSPTVMLWTCWLRSMFVAWRDSEVFIFLFKWHSDQQWNIINSDFPVKSPYEGVILNKLIVLEHLGVSFFKNTTQQRRRENVWLYLVQKQQKAAEGKSLQTFHHEFHEAEMWQSWTPLLPPPNLCEPSPFIKWIRVIAWAPPSSTRHKPLPPSLPPASLGACGEQSDESRRGADGQDVVTAGGG